MASMQLQHFLTQVNRYFPPQLSLGQLSCVIAPRTDDSAMAPGGQGRVLVQYLGQHFIRLSDATKASFVN